jgi:Putative peptidoglycan binding domain
MLPLLLLLLGGGAIGAYFLLGKGGALAPMLGAPAGATGPGGPAAPGAGPVPSFNLTYPGSGAWQTNSTYISAYQAALQYLAKALNQPSFDPGATDGTYGPNTAAAVKAFQSYAGVTADGEAGQSTADALQSALSKLATQTGWTFQHASGHMPGRHSTGWMWPHPYAAGGSAVSAICVWHDIHAAPPKFRDSVMAVAKTMAWDPEIPAGVSQHLVNGVMVKVRKPGSGHLQVLSYCYQGLS